MLLLLLIMAFPVSFATNEDTELLVCHIFRRTPVYQKQMLNRKSNCLGSVKIFEKDVCLLDKYNNVRKKWF